MKNSDPLHKPVTSTLRIKLSRGFIKRRKAKLIQDNKKPKKDRAFDLNFL